MRPYGIVGIVCTAGIAYIKPNTQPHPSFSPSNSHTNLEVARVDDGRAGDLVVAQVAAVDVDEDAGVRGAVRTRELDTRRELATVATSDLDLLQLKPWSV